MISPEAIAKKAQSKWRAVLRAHLAGESCFPLSFAAGKAPADLAQRRQAIERLQQRTGAGYSIEWKTKQSRALGAQTLPSRIVIGTRDNYLTLVGRRRDFEQFVADVALIRRRLPQLEEWLQRRPHVVVAHSSSWPDLLRVCEYFLTHGRPDLYIRELPIELHTKFVERNESILRELLDELLPPAQVVQSASDFRERYGLKRKPRRLRMRLLDHQLAALQIDDLTLPVNQLNRLLGEHIRPAQVIVVENLINFLTLPPLVRAVALFGAGYAVHRMRHLSWLSACEILYWGDVDAHGFQILSDLRGYFPQTQSILMDAQTLDDNRAYFVAGQGQRPTRFDNLTAAERLLAERVIGEDLRLEQEHIPHSYALPVLRAANARTPGALRP